MARFGLLLCLRTSLILLQHLLRREAVSGNLKPAWAAQSAGISLTDAVAVAVSFKTGSSMLRESIRLAAEIQC